MEKVTVKKTNNENYTGVVAGYKFHQGIAKDVPLNHAKYLAKHFDSEIVKPEQPKKPKEKTEPKKEVKPKQKAKPKAPSKKKGE